MKHYLLTGGTSGIGLAAVNLLYSKGNCASLVVRDTERAKTVFPKDKFPEIRFATADLSQSNNLESELSAAFAEEVFDGLVCCAGTFRLCSLRKCTQDLMQEIMAVNFFSPIQILRLFAAKKLQRRNPFKAVFISSDLSFREAPANSPYAASKAALEACLRSLQKDLNSLGMEALIIRPASVDTRMMDADRLARGADFDQWIKSRQPMGLIPPKEVASEIISFLEAPPGRHCIRVLDINAGAII